MLARHVTASAAFWPSSLSRPLSVTRCQADTTLRRGGAIQRDNRGRGGGEGVACRHFGGQCTGPPPETGSHDRKHVWERLEEARMLHVRMQGSWENANIRAHKLSRTGRWQELIKASSQSFPSIIQFRDANNKTKITVRFSLSFDLSAASRPYN